MLVNNKKKISVVLPCYNEEGSIESLLTRIGKISSFSFSVIIIDDGSRISLKDVLLRYDYSNSSIASIEVIEHLRNYGLEIAIQTGLKFAKDDWILVLDSDGQDPPELLSEEVFLNSIETIDVCRFTRSSRPYDSLFKRISAECYYQIMHVLTLGRFIKQSANFVFFRRELLPEIFLKILSGRAFRNSMDSSKYKCTTQEYVRLERLSGFTNYDFGKLLAEAFRNLSNLFLNSDLLLILLMVFFSNYYIMAFLGIKLLVKKVRMQKFQSINFRRWIL